MNILARVIAFLSLLCGAEVAASWWVWARAPTDSIRVWYSGFWVFEAGRLHYWIPVFAAVVALWIVAWYLLRWYGRTKGIQGNHQRRYLIAWWLLGAASAVGLGRFTSALYLRSARSSVF